jgi:hypothetical protein
MTRELGSKEIRNVRVTLPSNCMSKEVIVHEIGHYLYYSYDPFVSVYEGKFWNSKDPYGPYASWTAYGAQNVEEDYAETFAIMYL